MGIPRGALLDDHLDGDVLAVFMENNLFYLPLVWGGWRAGLRVTAVATHLSAEEVDYILDNSDAKALMTSSEMRNTAVNLKARGLRAGARFMLNVSAPGYIDLNDALAVQPATTIADQYEGVDQLYSSGTTGRPKGVCVTHRGLVNYLSWCTEAYAIRPGEVSLVHSSVAFDLTVTSLLAPLVAARAASVEVIEQAVSADAPVLGHQLGGLPVLQCYGRCGCV